MNRRRFGDHENIMFTSNIVNLTDEAINLYEDMTGNIVTFPPSDCKLPTKPIIRNAENRIERLSYPVYVVEWDKYQILKKLRRRLDDSAVVSRKSRGRDDIMIAYLFWARKTKCRVCFLEINERITC